MIPFPGHDATPLTAASPGHRSSSHVVFFGWYVMAACFDIAFFNSGARFAVGPFLKPIVDDLGRERREFSAIITLSLILYGICMPIFGRLTERYGPRPILAGSYFGAVALAVGRLLAGAAISFAIAERRPGRSQPVRLPRPGPT